MMLERFINIRKLTVDERLAALLALVPLLNARADVGSLAAIAQAALEAEQATRVLQGRWENQKSRSNSRPALQAADGRIDALLTLLEKRIQVAIDDANTFGRPTEALDNLARAAFPTGLFSHIRLPWIQQSGANYEVIAVLQHAEHAAAVATAGVSGIASELAAEQALFADLLREERERVEWGTLEDARNTAQATFVRVVAGILGQYAADEGALEALLAPVVVADETARARRRPSPRSKDKAEAAPAADNPTEDTES